MLRPNPQCDSISRWGAFGSKLGYEGGALMNGISTPIRRLQYVKYISITLEKKHKTTTKKQNINKSDPRAVLDLLPLEVIAKESMNQEAGSHHTPNLPAPLPWTFQSPEL